MYICVKSNLDQNLQENNLAKKHQRPLLVADEFSFVVFASLAKESAAQSIMHGKGRYPRLPCTGSSSSAAAAAAVQDTGDRRAALIPQRLGCQKSTDPLETTSSLFLPSCLGLGGRWDSGREGKMRAGGGLFPNFVSLFHCFIFALHYEPQTMYVYQNEGPQGESQGHVPNLGESSSVGFTCHAAQNITSHSKNRKSQTQNGTPSHFYGGKFRSVKLVSFTQRIPGHIFMN